LTSACRASRSSVLRILAADWSMMCHDVPLGIVSRVGRTDFITGGCRCLKWLKNGVRKIDRGLISWWLLALWWSRDLW
jgi:hypothetical protein